MSLRSRAKCVQLRSLSLARALAAPLSAHALIEVAVMSGTAWLKDVREYAGTGFGGETAHSTRLDFRVPGPPSFNYVLPTPPTNWSYRNLRTTTAKSFGVDPAYFGQLTSNGAALNPAYAATGKVSLTGQTNFEFRFPGATSRKVYVEIYLTATWDVYNPQNQLTGSATDTYTALYSATLGLVRRDVDMVAIDSRRVYGQPNLDGEMPADPNADLRNPSFAGWVYKGGLFVGMAGGNDQSGTARIQGWVPTATLTNPLLSSLTVCATGRPTGYAAPTLRAFQPSATDPNLAATSTTATWANKWDLAGATLLGEATGVETGLANEYWRLLFVDNPTKVGIALSDEAGASPGSWQYFATPGYESGQPLPDSRPRLWTVDLTASTQNVDGWDYWNGMALSGAGTLGPVVAR